MSLTYDELVKIIHKLNVCHNGTFVLSLFSNGCGKMKNHSKDGIEFLFKSEQDLVVKTQEYLKEPEQNKELSDIDLLLKQLEKINNRYDKIYGLTIYSDGSGNIADPFGNKVMWFDTIQELKDKFEVMFAKELDREKMLDWMGK